MISRRKRSIIDFCIEPGRFRKTSTACSYEHSTVDTRVCATKRSANLSYGTGPVAQESCMKHGRRLDGMSMEQQDGPGLGGLLD